MSLFFCLLLAAPLETLSYWIEPCRSPESRCEAGDPELAEWALEAWQKAAGGGLRLAKAAAESKARIRIYWVGGRAGLYGEMRPIVVDGQPGAAVYVRPDLAQLGPEVAAAGRADRLFRETVVYLTCLHETGHALGLAHTADFDDIMYFFGHGGDVVEYFRRYRRKLAAREDIRKHSGISPADQARLRTRYR